MSGGRIRPGSVRPKDNVVPFRDGLISLVGGMGTTTDPRSFQRYHARYMTDFEIDQAYRGSWVMRKAIDKPATEMVREWRDWQAPSDEIAKLEAEEKRLDLRNKVRRAEILRGLGGAGMVLYVGGTDADQINPLDASKLKAGDLKAIHVWHRSRFGLGEMITDWADPWFGYPAYFEVQLAGRDPIRFHPSRVVAFRAEHVSEIVGASWQDVFWGQARVQSIIDAVQNVDAADTGFAALIKDARNRRIYIPKLLDQVATAAGEAKLAKRLQAFALGESNNSVSWLDGGDGNTGAEKIEDRQMVWAGIPDIMSAFRTAAAAAADMPATVLWGISPQGMNATGDSDIQLWHKTVKGRQDLDLAPCMTQIDAALVPSALGKVDDTIWYEWAPLSTQSEKDEAATFLSFAQAVGEVQTSGLVPAIALEKAAQNAYEERGWLPGLGDALGELPEDERFPSLSEPDPNDPGEPATEPNPQAQAKGGGQQSAGAGVQPPAARRRAANDARFVDGAEAKTLYVERKLLNASDVITWAKKQGIATTLAAADMHVTVAYSRTPVDWFSVGTDWSSDKDGNLLVKPGGAREVRRLGDGDAVALLFASDDLTWRHKAICEAGASWDWPEYHPHVTLTWDAPGLDVSTIEPYTGPLKFGPELFSEVNEDWRAGIIEDSEVDDLSGRPFGDSYNPNQPRNEHGEWTAVGAITLHVSRAMQSPKEKSTTSLGKVSEHNAAAVLKHTGVKIAGFEREIRSDDIRHVMKSHGDPAREQARGQIAIKKADFERVPAIVENAHTITKEGDAQGAKGLRLVYTASLDGHEYSYAETVSGGKVVALKSMRKK